MLQTLASFLFASAVSPSLGMVQFTESYNSFMLQFYASMTLCFHAFVSASSGPGLATASRSYIHESPSSMVLGGTTPGCARRSDPGIVRGDVGESPRRNSNHVIMLDLSQCHLDIDVGQTREEDVATNLSTVLTRTVQSSHSVSHSQLPSPNHPSFLVLAICEA